MSKRKQDFTRQMLESLRRQSAERRPVVHPRRKLPLDRGYTCSDCGNQLFWVGHGTRRYLRCPNCGAKYSS